MRSCRRPVLPLPTCAGSPPLRSSPTTPSSRPRDAPPRPSRPSRSRPVPNLRSASRRGERNQRGRPASIWSTPSNQSRRSSKNRTRLEYSARFQRLPRVCSRRSPTASVLSGRRSKWTQCKDNSNDCTAYDRIKRSLFSLSITPLHKLFHTLCFILAASYLPSCLMLAACCLIWLCGGLDISYNSMASEAYREKANLKKERQAEEVWSKISEIPELGPLLHLHEKIKDLEKRRAKNREFIEETSSNYQALKKNIKDFAKTQNIDKKKR